MSDGNFNRALLPHTPYQSGMQAGKSMARMHAMQVLKDLLEEKLKDLTTEEIGDLLDEFRSRLSKKL